MIFLPGTIGHRNPIGNDAFTKVLLHMDGANAGTTFTDSNAGGSAHTWTPTNVTTSTANEEFGVSSALFAAGASLHTPDSSDFTLGSGNFTVDFWFNRNGNSGTCQIAGQCNSSLTTSSNSFFIGITSGNLPFASIGQGSTPLTITSGAAITGSAWHHLALVRNGGTVSLYIDGVSVASSAISGSINDSSNNFTVGQAGEATVNPFTGYIDEFRLSVGIARWTSNFTPPTAPYG